MSPPATSLEAAYEHCRLIHAAHGRTYYLATRLLPRARRPHVWALYAFARVADEFVDDLDAPDPDALVTWSRTAMAVLAAPEAPVTGDDPVLAATWHTVRHLDLEPALFEEFLTSMRMDITVDRYATWEDLRGYMRGSAAVIGEMMAPLLGAAGPDALRRAGVLGEAFQLTNFIRDVAEDLDRGRIYLPLEDLARFGVSEDGLQQARATGQPPAAVRALLAFEVRRALELYEDARPGLAMVDARSRPCLEAAFVLYRQILAEVATADHNVFAGRLSVPRWQRLATAGRVVVSGAAGASRSRLLTRVARTS
jgi:15-cis-phytoene synthase